MDYTSPEMFLSAVKIVFENYLIYCVSGGGGSGGGVVVVIGGGGSCVGWVAVAV